MSFDYEAHHNYVRYVSSNGANTAASISVSNANLLSATTSGTVTAAIATDSRVDSLKTLTGTNNYTIVISSADATGSTASELNTIDAATSVLVDAGAITAIEGTFDEIKTLHEPL